ncbi:hypothetical protein C8P68_102166 [Mucilaginibacter yixingensis]|uniref:O-antigen ligase-like membrane protein n=1 Tax=Mucilaginibacter yixingensis TaxID=1295612 RepID=A0A2T5JC67_9SPHI|nr:hypothetical protein [Mucilaginibacter yixingensis]PTQ99350.1 hypothetical protein C8P68_102166 [Mucilaginibacter yixingensis]
MSTATEQPLNSFTLSGVSQNALAKRKTNIALIRKGIWLYFILLLTEGALRKWVVPGLATPLLVVRDPLAVWLVVMAWKNEEMPMNWYIKTIWFVGFVGMFTALSVGHGNIEVALYGARILFLHFPLMFLMGRFFNREDVLYMGKVFLWLSLPMLVLITIQFYSPQSSFINRGVGGDMAGAGFAGALGYFRPPGVFSFTTGNTQFWSFVQVFVVYFWFSPKGIPRWLLIAATACTIAAIPLSISRTLVFQAALTIAFISIPIARRPAYLIRMLAALFGLIIILSLLNNVSFFKQATEALTTRVDDAGATEGGLEGTIGDRFLGGMLQAVTSSDQPFFGYGIGAGTNVGARLITGEVTFLFAEQEWGRLIGELGTILGLTVIFVRTHMCIRLLAAAYRRIQFGDLLPWMLLSLGFLTLLQGQWGQPTSLGFSTIIGGLMLSSLRRNKISVLDIT